MRILILEDDQIRVEKFKENFSGYDDLFITDSPTETISKLDSENWDWLFLDHDLGGNIFCPSDEKSGYAVAEWLEQNPKKKPKHIVLHSMNVVGRQKMKQAIPESIEALGVWFAEIDFRKVKDQLEEGEVDAETDSSN